MRRPVAFVAVITVTLLALGTPFLRISWGGTDARGDHLHIRPQNVQ